LAELRVAGGSSVFDLGAAAQAEGRTRDFGGPKPLGGGVADEIRDKDRDSHLGEEPEIRFKLEEAVEAAHLVKMDVGLPQEVGFAV
jgi:hypothetical protein